MKLRFPPTPEFAAKHAEMMVEIAREVSGADLDYTPASLELVDDIVEGMRQDQETLDTVGGTMFGFGCYLGEVMVRNCGATWRATEDTEAGCMTDLPIVIEMPWGHFCNPIGKVFKRLENGTEDYLPHFYAVFSEEENEQSAGEPCEVTRPKAPARKGFWRRLFDRS